MPPTRKISVRLTDKHFQMLEYLVEDGEFTSVSEAIRAAVKRLLEDYKDKLAEFESMKQYQ